MPFHEHEKPTVTVAGVQWLNHEHLVVAYEQHGILYVLPLFIPTRLIHDQLQVMGRTRRCYYTNHPSVSGSKPFVSGVQPVSFHSWHSHRI